MKLTCSISLCIFILLDSANAQTIQGLVLDRKSQPVISASVIVVGTFNAVVTDSLGKFLITDIYIPDTVILKVSSLGFETIEKRIPVSKLKESITIVLAGKVVQLQDVTISAGSFEANDEKKTTILRPFEIVTIPVATPDVFKAIEQLPGTSKIGESEGLFVRGGDASETKVVIDGMIVEDPFFSSVPGVTQKGRFSPLLFKGTSFSTGGYSAQYGQALSSVLLLNTQDIAGASSSSIVLSTPGLSGNVTHKLKNTSLAVNGNYYNLRPSFFINKQNFTYAKAPENGGGNVVFRSKGKNNGLYKLYASYEVNHVKLQIPYFVVNNRLPIYSLYGRNLYINSTYKRSLGDWQLNAGISFSYTADDISYDSSKVFKKNNRSQGRVVLTRNFNKKVKLFIGSELQYAHYKNNSVNGNYSLIDPLFSNFAETEFYIGKRIAARAGVRNEISGTLDRDNFAPRMSMAYVFNKFSQFSIAFGNFYQLPQETYLFTNHNLLFEKATHFIINYQLIKNNRTFRVEAYYKKYDNLVKNADSPTFKPLEFNHIPTANTNNEGFGYARGIDIFWYDKESIKNLNYWISYSHLTTKRIYQNFPIEVIPGFAAHHNISVAAKYSIPKTTVNIAFTYNYTSGRPYYHPNHRFLSDKTPPVHNLIFSGNYAWFKKNNLFALFAYVDNILGIKNIYNYVFSADGTHRYTITPPAYRSIYAGINITLAKTRTIMGINF